MVSSLGYQTCKHPYHRSAASLITYNPAQLNTSHPPIPVHPNIKSNIPNATPASNLSPALPLSCTSASLKAPFSPIKDSIVTLLPFKVHKSVAAKLRTKTAVTAKPIFGRHQPSEISRARYPWSWEDLPADLEEWVLIQSLQSCLPLPRRGLL